jgi:hypothetical protein
MLSSYLWSIVVTDSCTASIISGAAPAVSIIVAVAAALMAFVSTKLPSRLPMPLRLNLCIFCPPLPAEEGDEDAVSHDDNILFLTKLPDQSFETAPTGTASFDDDDQEENNTRDLVSLHVKSVKSTDRTIRRGTNTAQFQTASTCHTSLTKVKVSVPAIEETSHDPTVEIRRDSLTADADLCDDEGEGWYNIHCRSNYDCDNDSQSDASDLTMPSFRPGHEHTAKKDSTKRPKSKMLQKVQKAVYARVQTLRSKNPSGNNRRNRAAKGTEQQEDLPSCSCLILLMEPSSHTFEILPMSYLPGVSYVSDLLEQIPLQSSFNFRLRFQNYSGLMAMDAANDSSSKSSAVQLPQSKPVPMRYSCEFHHYEHQQKDAAISNSQTILPLVAILPDRDSVGGGFEMTETLARKLLSVPSVRKRLQFLQDLILSSPAKEEAGDGDDGKSG